MYINILVTHKIVENIESQDVLDLKNLSNVLQELMPENHEILIIKLARKLKNSCCVRYNN